jgi:hypothetical protein
MCSVSAVAERDCYTRFSGKHNCPPELTTSKMRKDDSQSESELIAIAGRFGEFDEFTEVAAAWDIDFRQLGRGRLNATLAQVVGNSWSLAKARFDRPAYQQGVAVPGMRTIAILDPEAPERDWLWAAVHARHHGGVCKRRRVPLDLATGIRRIHIVIYR